jgi:asparagine synthetase B (glutamine-hydrolysing)
MTNSFVLSKGKLPKNLLPLCGKLTTFKGQPDIIDYQNLSIGFSTKFNSNFCYEKGDVIVWSLPTAFNNIIDNEVVRKIHQAIENKEIENLIPPNVPSFLAYHKVNQKLYIFNSSPGYLPLYYGIFAETFWLTTEAKAFINSPDFPLTLRTYEFFSSLNYQAPIETKSVFENLYRVRSNELLVIDKTNHISKFPFQTSPYLLNSNEKEITNQLFERLNSTIRHNVVHSKEIGVALSGGYDSGSIVGVLHQQKVNFNTITIGSSVANEFTESKIVADAVRTANHSKLINEANYLQTYLETIFTNEINDTVIAEAFVGISELYQFAGNHCRDLFTGYGADILLGNLLNSSTENLNSNAFHF